jgi:hypothetical protein
MNPEPLRMLDSAIADFPTRLGAQVREHRTAAGLPPEMFAYLLGEAGIPFTPEEVVALEAGQRSNLDLRLLAALSFLLDVSVDKVFVAGFQGGSEPLTA